MNWKNRQLFSNREQGIMSGLDPIPMMGGGSVPYPGMQEGGPFPPAPEEPSIEERVAAIAAQQGISVPKARGQLLQATAAQQGMSLPPDVINQFAVGLISLHDALAQGTQNQESQQSERNLTQQEQLFFPRQKFFELNLPKMQTGGMVGMDLFEEGDQDVNEALNMMATVSNPEVPDMPATNGATVVEETVTEDQGPVDIKRTYQELAIQTVQAANDAVEQGAPVEQVKQPLQDRLLLLDEQYRQKSGKSDTILTEEFLAQLSTISNISAEPIPKMENGGEFLPGLVTELERARVAYSDALAEWQEHQDKKPKKGGRDMFFWNQKTSKKQKALDEARANYERLAGGQASTTTTPTTTDATTTDATTTTTPTTTPTTTTIDATTIPKEVDPINTLLESNNLTVQSLIPEMLANANRAKRGTMMAGKSKQGGVSGLMDVLGQSEVAAASAIGDVQKAALSQLGATERIEQQLGKPVSLTESERDLARGSPIFAQQLFIKRLGNNIEISDVVEEFIQEGIPLPDIVAKDLTGTITSPSGPVTFTEFYQMEKSRAKAENKKITFEEIRSKWKMAVANEPK